MTDTVTAHELLARWDAQQTAYIKHRDQRFKVMVDAIVRQRGERPRVLDLACGPGSLTAAILTELPDARIVAVDKDPILLAMAEEIFAGAPNVSVRAADIDGPDWQAAVEGSFDAVVSSTALHWLGGGSLARLYFEVAQHTMEDGLFLNADHLLYDALSQPTLVKLARADDQVNQDAAFGAGVDDWDAWWAVATAKPEYAEAARQREIVWEGKAPPHKVTLGFHLEALRSAGFRETGTIWQYLDDYVVCAVR